MKKELLLLSVPGLCAGTIIAQDTKSSATELPPVVVTATRLPDDPDTTAATTSVISYEQIQSRQLNSLGSALEGLPGLYQATTGTPGQQTSIFSRGTKSNHTLLLVDGRRLPPNLAGGFFYENLTLDNVERVEVVRSPSSVLYGGDAIGGVINVLTQSGRGLEKPEHQAAFEGGSFNTFRESAASRGAFGKFDYSVAASQLNAEYPRFNNDYRLTSFRGSTGYEVNDDLYLDLKGAYSYADGGSPGSITFPDPIASLQREVSRISPGLTWKAGEHYEAKVYYSFDEQWQRFRNQFGTDNRLDVQSHFVDWQNNFKITGNWTVVAGLDFQNVTFDQRIPSGISTIKNAQTGVGGYAQSSWSPWERFRVLNAVRFDAYSDYPDATTWRQGISWRVPKSETTLYANVSRSYSPPTAQDLYFPGFSNPNLDVEKSLGWEAGFSQPVFKDKLSFSTVWFQNKIDNFIQSPAPAFIPQNVAKATTEGIETELKFKPCKAFEMGLNYTYLTATDDLNHLRLIRRPRHQVGADFVAKPCEKVTLSSGLVWVLDRQDSSFPSQIPVEDYLTIRAAATYQINEHLQFWVRGENLTDNQYESVIGYPALRLAGYAGVRIKF